MYPYVFVDDFTILRHLYLPGRIDLSWCLVIVKITLFQFCFMNRYYLTFIVKQKFLFSGNCNTDFICIAFIFKCGPPFHGCNIADVTYM